MKIIQTSYKGQKFRSRLEARWAVYFDSLGLQYEYEKEGYDLAGLAYLPDFWLPELKVWVEIKASYPNEAELTKGMRLSVHTDSQVLFAWGNVDDFSEGQLLTIFPGEYDFTQSYWFYCCKKCGHVGISFEAKHSTCKCADWSGTHNQGRDGWEYDGDRIEQAVISAKSARFEHYR